MRIAIHPCWALLAGAALWLAACGDGHQDLRDKNTNWLRSCSDSKSCGDGLSCVCGVCTTVCKGAAACAAYEDSAVCVAPSDGDSACSAAETTAAQRVCSLPCKDDKVCAAQDRDLVCVRGTCARVPPRIADDAGNPHDASMAHDAAAPAVGDAAIRHPTPADAGARVDANMLDATTPNAELTCGGAFACDVMERPSRPIAALAVDDDFVYWSEWGSLDELGNHRHDGAIRRVAKDSDGAEDVLTDLDKPWRLWTDADSLYWLSGEPLDFDADQGLQTLHEAPRKANSTGAELRTDKFSHVQMHRGTFAWQGDHTVIAGGAPASEALPIYAWNPHEMPNPNRKPIMFTADPVYSIDGIDDTYAYFENGNLSVMRMALDSDLPEELLADPPAYAVTVGDDALWLIHTASAGGVWVSSLPKAGGPIVHVGDGGDWTYPPQPGAKVVWLLTWDGAGRWHLWSIPKSGGEREPAFVWTADTGRVPNEGPTPIWIADGDTAWVYGNDALVRVQRKD